MGYCGNVEGEYFLPRNEEQRQIAANAVLNITPDGNTFVKIGPFKEPRTKRQNSYLWGWIYANIVQQLNDSGQGIPLADDDGSPIEKMDWTIEILHEALASVYLSLPPIKTQKSEIKLRKSTAKLNKEEFNEYLENVDKACYQWWRISIPAPTMGVWYEYYKSLGFGNV